MELINDKNRKKYYKILCKTFLFRNCDESFVINAVNDSDTKWLEFYKGEEIYGYSDFQHSLGIILRGRISVNKIKDDDGTVLINYLKAGDAFGGAAVFSSSAEYVASLKAECDCYLLFLPKENLKRLFERSNEVALNYVEYLSNSLVFLNKRLDLFTSGSVEERVAKYIRINSIVDNSGNRVLPNFSFSRLAEYLAVGRASLYRILGDFEKKGIIKKEGKKIYILKEI